MQCRIFAALFYLAAYLKGEIKLKKEIRKKAIYTICECAMLVGLAVVISFIKIPVAAFGGSIDFVMIPLFIICYRNGAAYGSISGLCFGFIKCILSGAVGWGLPSILLDYVLAYGAVGVAGFFKNKSKFIELSVLLGCIARFIIHFISGITIYKILVPTAVEGLPWVFSNSFVYSAVYNAVYMLPNTIIAIIAMALLRLPLKKIKL